MAGEQMWWRVLDFWFRQLTPDQWFEGGRALDTTIRARFGGAIELALSGDLDDWEDDPRGRLALIIVLDQFARNAYRDMGEAFAGADYAEDLARDGVERGMDQVLTSVERQFFYMPLMHAENPALQDRSVALFEALVEDARKVLDFAKGHRAVVRQFGRFPMRNAALDRDNSSEEQAYLDAGGGYPNTH